jgi:energy-coupling factor transport system substrate-specific component
MSWEAYAYALLALVLVGGFAWYERSRPPARLVALVAALAALAVAGRLVFTPIPNVVATTDIVLITGFAVGAAPGFAVGALAAAVSNLWLGQGPWTPWEMAGWGLVGVGGAALGRLTGRRLGRVGLALACGIAGFAYGALLDFSVMVGYGGEQSLDRYLAISARGVPFNVAHATGNVVLALAAGPALVRIIARYRERFEFRWREVGAAPLALLVAVAMVVVAPPRAEASASSAVAWLARAQNSDGGFGVSPGTSSSATMTGWATLGLEAAGRSPLAVRSGGSTPIDYLRSRIDRVRSVGDLERTVLALEGGGIDSRHFAGRDLTGELRRRRAGSGSFQGQVNLTAFGILALRAAGSSRSAVGGSAKWLRRAQNRDGGWGFQPSAPSDADSTGAALQGLAAAGVRDRVLRHGAAYLRRNQRRSGGFALGGGGLVNSQSTAWAVQGLVAAGVSPSRVREHGRSPLDYLSARQLGDGHYEYSSSSDQTPVWVTGQALVAAKREAFPLRAVPKPERRRRSSGHSDGGAGSTSGSSTTDSQPTTAGASSGGASLGGGSGRHAAQAGTAVTAQGSRGNRTSGGGSGNERRRASPVPLAAPVDPAAPPSTDGGSPEAGYVAGGLAALAAVLAAGFLWYRRRLP